MPMIRVEMFAGRSREQKRAFTKAVTDAFVQTCGGTPQSVQVVFFDVEKDDWGVNGRLVTDPTPATEDGGAKKTA
ncbi:MAG: 4-oxalocrotonate tautomerase [Alphaproteobacteria bacterium]|nr:4-oxalocrotonate tautomerase [Alphaproteobacteria bacterium]